MKNKNSILVLVTALALMIGIVSPAFINKTADAQTTFKTGDIIVVKEGGKFYKAKCTGISGASVKYAYETAEVIGGKTYIVKGDGSLPAADAMTLAAAVAANIKLENPQIEYEETVPPAPSPVSSVTPKPASTATPTPAAAPANTGNSSSNANQTIDILFAYTQESAAKVGGAAKLQSDYIDPGVRLLNEALANSRTNTQVRAIPSLVEVSGVGTLNDSAQVSTTLGALTDASGDFAQVHKIRQQKKADLVVLVYNGYPMGKAFLGNSLTPSSPYIVTELGTFNTTYVFSHEFAHVMGCAHQNEQGRTSYARGFSGSITDSTAKYYGKGFGYRSIEANGGLSAPYFSMPGTITHPNFGSILMGDKDAADCSRNIREVAPGAASLSDNLPVVTAAGKYAAKLVAP